MPYTFVRIHKKNSTDYGVWYLKPDNVQDAIDHWKTICASEISETVRHRISGAAYSEDGAVMFPHPVTPFGMAVQAFCETTNQIYALGLLEIENLAYRSRIDSIRKGQEIYLAEGMKVLILDDRFFEVAETVTKDTIVYPSKKKWGLEDVRYMQWNMLGNKGTHWYAKIGNRDITDNNGNMKWDTKSEAEEAASWFLENKLNK